jgi:hypothetical protein
MNIDLLEWLGYLSSVIVAISLTMSSIVKLRWYNMIGAIAFSVYGFLIGSLPVGLLNLFIVCINIYYLYKLYAKPQQFILLKTDADDAYFKHFISSNAIDMNQHFPGFEKHLSEHDQLYFLLCDQAVAGVFGYAFSGNIATIKIDFVLTPYRDLKPGVFLFRQNKDKFKMEGIEKFITKTTHRQHIQYLEKMGFNKTAENYFLDI